MKKRKSQINSNLKIVLTTMTTLFFITIMGFYLFNLYINIGITKEEPESTYQATRTSRNSIRNTRRK